MWTTHSRAWEHELVVECEAYLSGRYARYLEETSRPVPGWAWLNLLARGSEADIAALASGEACDPGPTVWQQALSFLALELLSRAAQQGRTLEELQRSTLVPLEFRLAKRGTPPYLTPATFVSIVLAALSRHPSNRH